MFRIKKHRRGYVVEHLKSTWYGRRYWTHFISVSGISEEAWYYSSYEHAEKGLIFKVKNNTIINSR